MCFVMVLPVICCILKIRFPIVEVSHEAYLSFQFEVHYL